MKSSRRNNIILIIKISLIIVFLPFVLLYYIFKKYFQIRKNFLEKRIAEEEIQAEVYKQYQDNLASPLWSNILNK